MSNALAVTASPQPPAIPAILADRLADFSALEIVRGQVPAAVVAAAREILPALVAHLTPAPHALIELWLRNLRKSTAAISDKDFDGRVEAIKTVSGELPAWVWCRDALRSAMQTCVFFPTAADVDNMLRPRAGDARHRAWVARQLAAATPAPAIAAEEVLRIPAAAVGFVADAFRSKNPSAQHYPQPAVPTKGAKATGRDVTLSGDALRAAREAVARR